MFLLVCCPANLHVLTTSAALPASATIRVACTFPTADIYDAETTFHTTLSPVFISQRKINRNTAKTEYGWLSETKIDYIFDIEKLSIKFSVLLLTIKMLPQFDSRREFGTPFPDFLIQTVYKKNIFLRGSTTHCWSGLLQESITVYPIPCSCFITCSTLSDLSPPITFIDR